MDKYNIIITPSTIDNISLIASYISIELSNSVAANRFIDNIQEEIRKLDTFPLAHPLVQFEPWRSRGLRKLLYKSFIIYYVVDEIKKEVIVLAVIYGMRDQLTKIKNLSI